MVTPMNQSNLDLSSHDGEHRKCMDEFTLRINLHTRDTGDCGFSDDFRGDRGVIKALNVSWRPVDDMFMKAETYMKIKGHEISNVWLDFLQLRSVL